MADLEWFDEFITHKSRRPSPEPEPTPGNKARRKKGQKDDGPVAVAVIERKDDGSEPTDPQMLNGYDISWLEEPGEGIATKKWSDAARKAALATRRAKSRAKGGLGGAASGAGAPKIVPRAMKPAVVKRMDKLSRSDPKAYNKAIKQHAKSTGVDPKRAHAQVASFQLDETIARRRASPGSTPKGLTSSPHAAAQRAAQKRGGGVDRLAEQYNTMVNSGGKGGKAYDKALRDHAKATGTHPETLRNQVFQRAMASTPLGPGETSATRSRLLEASRAAATPRPKPGGAAGSEPKKGISTAGAGSTGTTKPEGSFSVRKPKDVGPVTDAATRSAYQQRQATLQTEMTRLHQAQAAAPPDQREAYTKRMKAIIAEGQKIKKELDAYDTPKGTSDTYRRRVER